MNSKIVYVIAWVLLDYLVDIWAKKTTNNLPIIVVIIDWLDWCVTAGHQREDSSPLCDTSDRPLYIKPPDKTVMPIVSEEEIQETQLKKDNLVFDIETVVCV